MVLPKCWWGWRLWTEGLHSDRFMIEGSTPASSLWDYMYVTWLFHALGLLQELTLFLAFSRLRLQAPPCVWGMCMEGNEWNSVTKSLIPIPLPFIMCNLSPFSCFRLCWPTLVLTPRMPSSYPTNSIHSPLFPTSAQEVRGPLLMVSQLGQWFNGRDMDEVQLRP